MTLLYIFISCKSKIDNCYTRITNMMNELNYDNYIIVTGGNETNIYHDDKHLLELVCNDFYEGLPEKVIKTYKFIYENKSFERFTHFCKLDDDMIVKKIINNSSELPDYCGRVDATRRGNRRWHINKCSKDSFFNNNEYTGAYVPWCLGGCGYIISKKSLQLLSSDTDYYNEIYEDVYVAKILYTNNIYPQHMSNLSAFIYSEDHQ